MNSERVYSLAKQLLEIYSEETLFNAFKSFSWRESDFALAMAKRKNLESSCPKVSANSEQVVSFFSDVNHWGFGRNLPHSLTNNDAFQISATRLLSAWRGHIDSEKKGSMAQILEFKGLGIATVSKFTAMIDPEYAAIYDSRVTATLNPLLTNGVRTFPIVGRRPVKNKEYFKADITTSLKSKRFELVEKYMLYLDMLTSVRRMITSFSSNSEIEIALFMLGRDIQDSSSRPRK